MLRVRLQRLVEQTASEFTTRLERVVLAHILRSALEPLSWINRTDTKSLSPHRLEEDHKACRKDLDPLVRCVATEDTELMKEALVLANAVLGYWQERRAIAAVAAETNR